MRPSKKILVRLVVWVAGAPTPATVFSKGLSSFESSPTFSRAGYLDAISSRYMFEFNREVLHRACPTLHVARPASSTRRSDRGEHRSGAY